MFSYISISNRIKPVYYMAELLELILYTLIIANILISWQGFRNQFYLEKYIFEVDKILINKQYYRLFTAGFLHGGWWHLLFNMTSLYIFSRSVGNTLGIANFITIYFGSLLLSSLLSLYIHRNHGDYRAVGASGAISGVVFSYVAMFPNASIGLLFVPNAYIDAWIFGIIYVAVCIWGIKRDADNIGHDAHLGGALAGVFITILIEPLVLVNNYIPIIAITVPALLFLALVAYKPTVLMIENYWGFSRKKTTSADTSQKNYDSLDDETALNELLEKVSEKGYQNLTKQEKKKLEELSKKIDVGN
jgi:membrane associated rhomboid family serine protease